MKARESPIGFADQLGVVGWHSLEPVLLAALALEAPVLLVGAHGTAKSMLVERIALELGLEFRHYNASLLNYDDLVGIPLPDDAGAELRFVTTPGAIWTAEFVFLDEISRCRVDLQNKLFPIVHERRVAGIRLERLRHRWAAMNPPAALGQLADEHAYIGSEPLDPALADRFPFIVSVPGWQELRKEERVSVVSGSEDSADRDGPALSPLVARTKEAVATLEATLSEQLAEYVVLLIDQLEQAGLPQSPRRARTLARAIVATHAAQTVLVGKECELEQSAELAVRCGLPQLATEVPPGIATLVAAHKQAWEVSRLAQDDGWRQVLEEPDRARRVVLADEVGLDDGSVSRLITQALSSEDSDARRVGLATAMFLHFRERRNLQPAAWEPLAQLARRVLEPRTVGVEMVPGRDLECWREVNRHLADEAHQPGRLLDTLERNFLLCGFPDLWRSYDWSAALEAFRADLRLFGIDGEEASA